MNGDGHVDLARANGNSKNFELLFGQGAGSFEPSPTQSIPGFPIAIRLDDIDGDGLADVSLFSQAGVLRLLRAKPDGILDDAESFAFEIAQSNGLPAFAVGDFNEDGVLDFAVSQSVDPSLGLLLSAP